MRAGRSAGTAARTTHRLTLLAVLLAALAVGTAPGAQAADGGRRVSWPTPSEVSTRDAQAASAMVAAEDRRLNAVRAVSSLASWPGKAARTPFRLSAASGYTLVLTPRTAPYTLDDLLALEPQTLLHMSDGAYLLTEHIVVLPRAVLRITAPGLTLRLASGTAGFATIVSVGGTLELLGAPGAPLHVASWDADAAAADTEGSDGRAYLRSIGGRFRADHVDVSDLGFWSGRTGGVSLTGTDRPSTGALSTAGSITRQPAGALSARSADRPRLRYSVPAHDYVSASISDTTFTGNAYGLFVSGASGVTVSDTTARDSRYAGVVLHRFVTHGSITRTSALHNGGNGFTLDRGTADVSVTDSTAADNTGSGISVSGRALADGPSSVGLPLVSYGNNAVLSSVARDNGRYGIEVLGGFNVQVRENRVAGNDMGVVVAGPATRVSVSRNEVTSSARHGIALLGAVRATSVTENRIDRAATGVYLRDSAADVRGNAVTRASSHGISLVGDTAGTSVGANELAGAGPSALDTVRSTAVLAAAPNRTSGWDDTSPWYVWLRALLLHPMNLLWLCIGLLMALSALRSRRRVRPEVDHPYAHQMVHGASVPAPHPVVVDLRPPRHAAHPITVEGADHRSGTAG